MSLYVGIDIGKSSHVAALLSLSLLATHKRPDACPLLSFPQSRTGFEEMTGELSHYARLDTCCVLIESTGHYGYALIDYLHEQGVQVYQVHPHLERKRRQKSDSRDARALAVLLYNHLEKGVLSAEPSEQPRLIVPPSETVQALRGLMQHRAELIAEQTQRKNKLTAIADELFPELASVYLNVNSASALALREAYPTPELVGTATLDELLATRKRYHPSTAALSELQEKARHTIGTKNSSRKTSLLLEQKQLIAELYLLQEHTEELDSVIEATMKESREGRIVRSFPAIGTIQAAIIVSSMGSIANYENAAKLRAYCGWSPHQSQTGTSKDSMTLTRGGHPLLKRTFYLIALNACRYDTQWRVLYQRLLPVKGVFDERTGKYRGRRKVLGRVIGQMIRLIYRLLRDDYEMLARLPVGSELPDPVLYDVSKHRIHATPANPPHLE